MLAAKQRYKMKPGLVVSRDLWFTSTRSMHAVLLSTASEKHML